MLFTWDTTNLCIVFRQWRITGLWSLIWSLIAIALLTAGYEAIRELARRYEAGISFSGLGKRNSDDGLGKSDSFTSFLIEIQFTAKWPQQQKEEKSDLLLDPSCHVYNFLRSRLVQTLTLSKIQHGWLFRSRRRN